MSSTPETAGTSAAVYDFICLFTHDLKRKQKRWQDGKLKYHTFNKKLMVYDDRGNFVGESHWQEDGDLEDGCELALERGGAIVQVAECVGSRTQDLTELIDKRAKEVETRRANKATRIVPGAVSTPSSSRLALAMHTHNFQQRPLASLVRSPGPIGRAVVPSVSPYESRIAERSLYMVSSGTTSTSKRKRSVSPPGKMGHARALFGTQLSLSATPLSLSQVRRNVLSQKPVNVPPPPPEISGPDEKSQDTGRVDQSSTATENRDRHLVDETMQRQTTSQPETEKQDMTAGPRRPDPRTAAVIKDLESPEKAQTRVERTKVDRPGPSKILSPDGSSEPRHVSKRQRSPSLGSHATKKRAHCERRGQEAETNENSAASSQNQGLAKPRETIDMTEDKGACLATTQTPKTGGCRGRPTEKRLKPPPQAILRSDRHAQETGLENRDARDMACEADKAATDKIDPQQPLIARPEPRNDEPRTELRIRPRQKRGLLMLSEKKAQALPRFHKSMAPVRGSDDSPRDPKATNPPAPKPRLPNQVDLYDLPISDEEPALKKTKKTDSVSNRWGSRPEEQDKRFEEWLGTDDSFAEAGSVSPDQSGPTRRTRTKSSKSEARNNKLLDEEDLEEESYNIHKTKFTEDQVVKGPRIERLARKSIKSREIIGFIPSEGVHFQMPFNNHGFTGTLQSAPALPGEDLVAPTEERHTAAKEPSESQSGASPVQQSRSPSSASIPIAQEPTAMSLTQPGKAAVPAMEPAPAAGDDQFGTEKPGCTMDVGAAAPTSLSQLLPLQAVEERESVVAKPNGSKAPMESLSTTPGSHRPAVGGVPHDDETGKGEDCIQQGDVEATDPLKGVIVSEGNQINVTTSSKWTVAVPKTAVIGSLTSADNQVRDDQVDSEQSRAVKLDDKVARPVSSDESVPGQSGPAAPPNMQRNTSTSSRSKAADELDTNLTRSCSCACSASEDHPNTNETGSSLNGNVSGACAPRQISNPATRGRKAAAKKDAAGMAPRTLVQLDPPRPVIMRRAPAAVARPAPQLPNSVVSAFTTANGGAWSKHAHDLLGMTRPGKATAE